MAIVLGFILVFLLGTAIGGWAVYDWLHYRGLIVSPQQHVNKLTQAAIEELLDRYNEGSIATLTRLHPADYDSDGAA